MKFNLSQPSCKDSFYGVVSLMCECSHLQEKVDLGIEAEGSNLSGVSSKCSWEEPEGGSEENKENVLVEGDRRGSSETADRPRISAFGKALISQLPRCSCLLHLH